MFKKLLITIAFISLFFNLSTFAQVNNGLSFDGTNDYVSIPASTDWALGTGNFTVEWWQYQTDGNSYPRIFSLNGDNFGVSIENFFGNWRFYCWLGSSSTWALVGTYKNEWVHFAITRSSGTVSIYKNGTYLGGGTNNGNINNSTDPLLLGKKSLASEYFGGNLDEVRFWNVARTLTEINNNLNTSLVGNEAGLLAYYNFNQGVADGNNTGLTTLNDITLAGSHDGTLTNFALTGNTSNWVDGKYFNIIYVKQDASGSNDGTSWANAYISFQSALDVAVADDHIWVAKGTYKPSSAYDLTNTSRYYHFRMKDGVAIYGGFAGTEAVTSQRIDFADGGANETILSGDIGTVDNHTDNCYHIFYHPSSYGLTSSAILNGCTIKYGYADDNTGASHLYRGGGMYNGSGNQPTIDQCSFLNNYAGNGGGLYNLTCSPSVSNCVFSGNTANNFGGGIYNTTSANPTITNCLVVNNNAVATGGGIYSYATDFATDACNPVITNTTIANNSANLCGGVRILVSTTTLNNCIIWGNTHISDGDGSQIYMSGTGSSTTLNYSCYSNGINDIHGTLTTSNCITTDPQFAGSGTHPFLIIGASPCADAGNNSYNTTSYDIREIGFSRKLDKTNGTIGTIDIGSYEYKFGVDLLPVELTLLYAITKESSVTLNWQTATEVNNYGFEVEKVVGSKEYGVSGNWRMIGFVKGNGNSNSLKEYSFTDNDVSNGKYSYRLKQIDTDGSFTYSNVMEVTLNLQPETFQLFQNYPNPFNPSTVISYQLPVTSRISLRVFDIIGNEVATLVNEEKSEGSYNIEFNASSLPSGFYFYQLQSGSFNETRKMILMK